jgi:hypothetical protein
MHDQVGYWQKSSLGVLAAEYPHTLYHLLTEISATHQSSQLGTYNQSHRSSQISDWVLLPRHFFLVKRLLTSTKRCLPQSDHSCTGCTSREGKTIEGCGRDWLTANVSRIMTAKEANSITYMMKTRSQRKSIFPRRLCSESHRYITHSMISISERNYVRVSCM